MFKLEKKSHSDESMDPKKKLAEKAPAKTSFFSRIRNSGTFRPLPDLPAVDNLKKNKETGQKPLLKRTVSHTHNHRFVKTASVEQLTVNPQPSPKANNSESTRNITPKKETEGVTEVAQTLPSLKFQDLLNAAHDGSELRGRISSPRTMLEKKNIYASYKWHTKNSLDLYAVMIETLKGVEHSVKLISHVEKICDHYLAPAFSSYPIQTQRKKCQKFQAHVIDWIDKTLDLRYTVQLNTQDVPDSLKQYSQHYKLCEEALRSQKMTLCFKFYLADEFYKYKSIYEHLKKNMDLENYAKELAQLELEIVNNLKVQARIKETKDHLSQFISNNYLPHYTNLKTLLKEKLKTHKLNPLLKELSSVLEVVYGKLREVNNYLGQRNSLSDQMRSILKEQIKGQSSSVDPVNEIDFFPFPPISDKDEILLLRDGEICINLGKRISEFATEIKPNALRQNKNYMHFYANEPASKLASPKDRFVGLLIEVLIGKEVNSSRLAKELELIQSLQNNPLSSALRTLSTG